MSGGNGPRVGVDIGGTFTDLVAVRDGRLTVTKTASTPAAPEQGVVDGLEQIDAEHGVAPATVAFLAHGTTVATNAVLEQEWATTAVITTEGFRDVLEIGRQTRPEIYDFQADKPAPIVPRDRRYEVPERLNEHGDVVTPLDETAVRSVAAELADEVDEAVDSVAVALLFAFENDTHEQRVREILRDEGLDAEITLSSETLPEIREYERTLATALNGALMPVMDSYLGTLSEEVTELGIQSDLQIMQSNGGLMSATTARQRPIQTLLSGPAGGVQGANYVAGLRGEDDIITMDMGGTSCDVSLVRDGEPLVATDLEVGAYPVSVPMIDIHTVGAGGGSEGWIDDGGALRVGPKSAGADPGPICYGRGGTVPTITDAQVLLGRLDPTAFLTEAAAVPSSDIADRIAGTLADPLGLSVEEAAAGLLEIANANMEQALRVVSVERGYDPREFTLVAFGGAGPLHATALADLLDIPRVIIPPTAGVLSALGLLISDVLYDFSRSRVRAWHDLEPAALSKTLDSFTERGRERLRAEGLDADQIQFERSLDIRYDGQSFELSVAVPPGEITSHTLTQLADRFHRTHERRYGYAYEDEPLELVTVRCRARGVTGAPSLTRGPVGSSLADAVTTTRPVVFQAESHQTKVYARERLPADTEFAGPAIITGGETTIVVRPGQTARLDEYRNLIVETGS